MKAGFLQFNPVFGKVKQNLRTIEKMLKEQDFDLMVLPELCTTGYQFVSGAEALSLSESPGGELGGMLLKLAKNKNAVIVAGFAEKEKDKVFNSAMAVGPEGILSVYRKAHLFFKEKQIFRPGDTPFVPVDTGFGYRLGIMICFDWIFPEAARSLALGGASVIAHPSNLVLPWCQRAMFARSVENRVFIITANRFGTETRDSGPPLTFTGESQVITPAGETAVKAGPNECVAASCKINLSNASPALNEFNHLYRNRRSELYRL
ncbi:MAG: acyltransferase [Acidobacteria bacterium]|nr:acyltransferase [Acidobacteriota bacterium]